MVSVALAMWGELSSPLLADDWSGPKDFAFSRLQQSGSTGYSLSASEHAMPLPLQLSRQTQNADPSSLPDAGGQAQKHFCLASLLGFGPSG